MTELVPDMYELRDKHVEGSMPVCEESFYWPLNATIIIEDVLNIVFIENESATWNSYAIVEICGRILFFPTALFPRNSSI